MSDAAKIDPERVLVLAPTSVDAAMTGRILAEAALPCNFCTDLRSLAQSLDDGAGAILLTDDAATLGDTEALHQALRSQPPWSEIPIVFLAGAGADSPAAAWAMETLGNVTVLERPVRVTTLVSALRTAIRARNRQYELRDQLMSLVRAEASIRMKSERLRLLLETASALPPTVDTVAMMQILFLKIAPHLRLDAYFHVLRSESDDALHVASCYGISQEDARHISEVEHVHELRSMAVNERKPILEAQMRGEDQILQLLNAVGMHVYTRVPLVMDDRLVGTLSFAGRRREQFDADELEFLRTISRYFTVAFERVRLIHQLRDSDRRKDEFLATLAHELRNPLAPIRNALQIIRLTGSEVPAIGQARIMMERQLRQMVRLIDDLLDVSRINRGKLELRKERVELAAVITNAVETARPMIEAAGHELTIALGEQPVYLDADPVRLGQVFSNLLNNSAKYMERGGHIWLTSTRGEKEVTISVRDTGIGIPPGALSAIFDMFTQVDRSLEKSQGGLGIGLTLVKRLVEMHGGSIEARSEGPGRGAEFVARLPVASVEEAPKLASVCEELESRSPACRILVADDNRDAAESMGMLLRLSGNEVRTVNDGLKAIEEAAVFRPDLILLDIGMPQMNGYEAARRIRAQQWGKSMVLVALTGWGQEEDRRRASEAGFDQHFTKPVSPADLDQLVAGLQTDPRRRDRLQSS
jgi:signal transduction histidine kinase/CheY-like chemotaxis protein